MRLSIPANIAEGFRKRSRLDKARFMNMAEGSVEESRYYLILAQDLGFETITAIPMSALEGHNVVDPGYAALPWYEGSTLLAWLETVPSIQHETALPFAMATCFR